METFLSTFAFVAVIAAQFLAVIAVRAMHAEAGTDRQSAMTPANDTLHTVHNNANARGAASS